MPGQATAVRAKAVQAPAGRSRSCRGITRAAVALTVLLPLAGGETPGLPPEGDRWIRVTTAHFTLFSNASQDYTLEVGRRLELFRIALSRLDPNLEVNSPLPTSIYVFRNDHSFSPYKQRFGGAEDNLAGYFAGHRDGNYVGVNATPEGNPFIPIYHEYTHYFINNNFPNVPLWFNEGIAECYSSFRATGPEIEIGRPIAAYADRLSSEELMPIARLLAVRTSSREYNERDRTGTFYAQSWALVHHLLWGKPGWASHLSRNLARLDEGTKLSVILGLEGDGALEETLRRYLKRRRFLYTILDAEKMQVDDTALVDPMTRAEALYRLGDLLSHLGPDRSTEAERHFRETIRLDSSHAAAHRGLGFIRDLRGDHEEASAFYEQALDLDPNDYLTHFLHATSLIDRRFGTERRHRQLIGDTTPPLLARARELFSESIRLRPDLPEAYAGLGATYTLDESDLEEGIAALEKARRLLPSRMDIVFNLVGLYARSGERRKAQHLIDEVLGRADDPVLLADARESMLQGELVVASRLLKEGRVDETLAILRRVQATTRDPELRGKLESRIADIIETREGNRLIDLYNEAVERVNKRDYREAAAILREVLRDAKDPKLVDSARKLLADLERALGGAEAPRN
jgi:tetratricopeptide (TPR) repeat protein